MPGDLYDRLQDTCLEPVGEALGKGEVNQGRGGRGSESKEEIRSAI